MILFKKIRWKNLLSTGNVFTELDLTRSKTTLIVGENGAGKSTILDALSYALYGKPFRKVNKPQLINTVNGRELLVELEFSIGRNEYKIVRGMKPNVFEVYQNDVMINQNAAAADYQEMLEKQILKLNHKSFSQIVVLGSASFIPFMQLPAAHRREVIEDLLDLQIFSTMNTLLKEKLSTNKAALLDADYQILLTEEKITLQRQHLQKLQKNNDEVIASKEEQIVSYEARIAETATEINTLIAEVQQKEDGVSDQEQVAARLQKLEKLHVQLSTKLKKIQSEIEFFQDHDNCPTCKQHIGEEFKCDTVKTKEEDAEETSQACDKIYEQVETLMNRNRDITKTLDEINKLNIKVSNSNIQVHSWNQFIEGLRKEISALRNQATLDSDADSSIKDLEKDHKEWHKKKEELTNDRSVLDVASTLLKDGGIKSRIIKQYVPVINKLINKYLAALDFFVNFELNENFEEKIKSRFRDEFSYESFSEGEKMRIDLALLFTWRAVAKLRNSISTNLLIMDEVFDSSLDSSGTDEFLKILDGLTTDTNVFIISHKTDVLYDKFRSVIKFEKHKNYSRIAA